MAYEDPVQLNDLGASYYQVGKYEEALECFTRAVRLQSGYGKGWLNRANALVTLKRGREAWLSYNRAVDASPLFPEAWYYKGVAERMLGMDELSMASTQLFLATATQELQALVKEAKRSMQELSAKGTAMHPPDAFALCKRGLVLAIEKSNLPEALKAFDAALRFSPKFSKALMFKAMCLTGVGQSAEALAVYKKAFELEPANPVFAYNIGLLLAKLGRHDDAVAAYRTAIGLDPEYLEAISNLGRLLGSMGQHEEALKLIERAVEIAPKADIPWFNKALALDAVGRAKEAAEAYIRFLDLASPQYTDQIAFSARRIAEIGNANAPKPSPGGHVPSYAAPAAAAKPAATAEDRKKAIDLNNLGIAQLNAGAFEQAIEFFDMASVMDPTYVNPIYNKALALSDLERDEEAVEFYDHALSLDPKIAIAWINKGVSLRKLGRIEDAVACFDKALVLDPNEAVVWFNKGKCLADLGRPADARNCYERALGINPNYTAALNNIGDSFLDEKRYEESIAYFDKVIAIDPKHAFAWNNKGCALHGLGKFTEALQCFNRALMFKQFAAPMQGAGDCLRELKKYREAMEMLKRAIAKYGKYDEAWHSLAEVYEAMGYKAEAIDAYKKSIEYSKKPDAEKPLKAAERLKALGMPEPDVTKLMKRTVPTLKKARPRGTGEFIGQKYEVIKLLGQGGFGKVYHVYSVETGNEYALKTFRDEYMKDEQTRALFRKEAQVLVDMDSHPFLVTDHFVDEVSGRLYIAMEYIASDEPDMSSLEGRLAKRPPDLIQALRWAIQFCMGMEFAASEGVRCHRDIKPANIMIDQTGTVKISDFGLAGLIDTRGMASAASTGSAMPATMVGMGAGTPTHMPPEQFISASSCDHRSDIYSFGIVLYQMCAGGRLPFLAQLPRTGSPAELTRFWTEMQMLHTTAPVPALDSPLNPIIQKCLAKSQPERYPNFTELRADLEPLLLKLGGEVVKPPDLDEMNAAEWLNKGLSLKNLGRLEDAMDAYDRCLSSSPQPFTSSLALANKGNCLQALGRLPEALKLYDEALKLNAMNEKAWCNRGLTLHNLGKYREAMECYERSITCLPTFAIAWANKALTHMSLGELPKAVSSADAALKHDPSLDLAWVNKGAALYGMNKDKEALACYDKAISINASVVEAHFNRGLCLNDLSRWQEAVAAFDEAIRLRPDYKDAWANRGRSLMGMKRHEEAVNDFKRATEIDPSYPKPWYFMGYAMINLKNKDEAVRCLREFIRLSGGARNPQVDDARARLRGFGVGA